MQRGSDYRTPPVERSPPPTPTTSKRKASHRYRHHRQIRKKEKLIISETEIETETETKTLTLIPNSKDTHTNSYTYSHQIHKKQQHRRRTRKLAFKEEQRRWNYSPRDFSNYKDRVVFVSYNILGVENASKHPDLYRCVSPEYLDWDYRKRCLRKEIKGYKPGIVCFQEVDRFDDIDAFMRKDGFRGVYKSRTGEACDGCAIFWKDELFTLLHEESIEFQRLGLRNNIAQLCVFKMNQNQSNPETLSQRKESPSSRNFLVGNIHVLFNPSRGDIKLGQMRLLLEKAQKLSQEWGSIPVVLAGDLNSMPWSPMYQFLTTSKLDIQLHDRRQISGQICPQEYPAFQSKSSHVTRFCLSRPKMHRWTDEELMLATGSRMTHLRHLFKLHSAYVGVPASSGSRDCNGEPLATSYHSKFMGTVDYIWHTAELLPIRVLETLPINILRKTRGLPSKKWGSDHLALVCELAFTDDDNAE